MLISCPKCHSIYEIPDDLIGKTGQNFRCQACANVWHAMRSDALGYTNEEDGKPFIEPIPVSTPPERPYPSEKAEFIIPADRKTAKRTLSSSDVRQEESVLRPVAPAIKPVQETTYLPISTVSAVEEISLPPKTEVSEKVLAAARRKSELTLDSGHGSSFTISLNPEKEIEEPRLSIGRSETSLTVSPDDRLALPESFKGYRKTCAFLILLFLVGCALLLRREAVALFPETEPYYNKIGLSGLHNPQYLKFSQITVADTVQDDNPAVVVKAEITNDSVYTTVVPEITVNGTDKTFTAGSSMLKGGEKTEAVFTLPAPVPNAPLSLNIGFAH